MDSEAWKDLHVRYPEFGVKLRNVRKGLASYGFNLFGLQSSGWLKWPAVLMPYNLPPWLCMKQPFILLSLLIPEKYAPGNDIDVYLEPLIDELKVLWTDGVKIYDAESKQNFTMRAVNCEQLMTSQHIGISLAGQLRENLLVQYVVQAWRTSY